MARPPFTKFDLIRACAPTLIGIIILIFSVGNTLHHNGLILAILLATLTPLAYVLILIWTFRSRLLLLYLVLDSASLYCTGLATIALLFLIFPMFPRQRPFDLLRWVVIAVGLLGWLGGLANLYFTGKDLYHLWTAARTYFGYPPKPPASQQEIDPAEFPVTPGWDNSSPKPSDLPTTTDQTPS